MATNTYMEGTLLRVSATWTDADGNADSPDAVTWTVKNGAGTVSAPSDVADGAGASHVDLDTTGAPGRWYVYAKGSANPQAAAEISFLVRPIRAAA